MKYSWRIKQFIYHINNIKHKTLVSVEEEFINSVNVNVIQSQVQ